MSYRWPALTFIATQLLKRAIPLVFIADAALVQAAALEDEPVPLTPFEARVRLAKEAEENEQFKMYRLAVHRKTGRYLVRTMRSCIAALPKPQQKSFVLIADITPTGKAAAVEVKPDNEVARCYASGFAAASFPRPPAYPGRQGFPVMMKIRVGT